MFEGLFQPVHLVLILALVLIFFGPGKLNDLGASLGSAVRELRRGLESRDEPAPQGEASGAPAVPPDVHRS